MYAIISWNLKKKFIYKSFQILNLNRLPKIPRYFAKAFIHDVLKT